MAGRINIVVGHRCQLIAAKALRRALGEHAEAAVIYAGGTHAINLAAPYFQETPFARPDHYLGVPVGENRVRGLVQALMEMHPLAEETTGWLLLGVGPEATAAALVARCKNEPLVWWDEGQDQPHPQRSILQALTGLMEGTATQTPKPWRAAARSLMPENINPPQDGSVFIALTDDPLWRLHEEEFSHLVKHLLEAGRAVTVFAPGNNALMANLPKEVQVSGGPSLKSLLEEVERASLVLSDRLDVSVGAVALGRCRWHLGVSTAGLVHGQHGEPLKDFMELGGHLVTLMPQLPDNYDPLEEIAQRWVQGLDFFLKQLT